MVKTKWTELQEWEQLKKKTHLGHTCPEWSVDSGSIPKKHTRDLQNLSIPLLQVILESKTGQAELELFPRYLLFLRQQPATRSPQSNIWVNMGMTSLRMFPPYLPPPRGNVSLQQDQSKPSTNASLSYPASCLFNPPQSGLPRPWQRSGLGSEII